MGLSVATMFGGVSHRPQIAATRNGVDVLVATPGRLIDHMEERNIVLSGTEILVLDEADQMLDMGFIRPIKQIIRQIPAKRQNLFFSATMTPDTSKLAAEILRNPVEVAVTPRAKTADRVTQQVIHIEAPKKRALLVELFSDPALSRALVFTRTKRGADRVAKHLEAYGVAVSAIHGNKSQGQREAALAAFKAGRIRALVATDVAARGIDIDEVTHVVNYELPNLPESYVHRIGRTARAGAEGIAISLCDAEERAYLRDIEKLIRQSIPSSNRCGDATLIVEERVSGKGDDDERDERRGSRQGRPQRNGQRSAGRSAGPSRSGEAKAASPAARGRPGAGKPAGQRPGAARRSRAAPAGKRRWRRTPAGRRARSRPQNRFAGAANGSWGPGKKGGGQRQQPSR